MESHLLAISFRLRVTGSRLNASRHRVMGTDYHAHGLDKNRHALDVFCRSAFLDGLTKRRLTVEDFFADFLKA